MPSRNIPDRADAVKEAPKCRAYRWSSSTQPRTNSSVGASCCEGLSPPSAIPGADSERTASVSAQSIREHFGSRTADIQNRPANGRQPSTTGTPLRWRTATEIRASSSEMPVEPRRYTTACAVLKQPDKQKPARANDRRGVPPPGSPLRQPVANLSLSPESKNRKQCLVRCLPARPA